MARLLTHCVISGMEQIMKLSKQISWIIAACITLGCAEAQDDQHQQSPVLDQDPVIHEPGGDPDPNLNPSNPGNNPLNPNQPIEDPTPDQLDCTKTPEDPKCQPLDIELDCTKTPDDPKCQTQLDCTKTPDDPKCQTQLDCDKTPDDPQCQTQNPPQDQPKDGDPIISEVDGYPVLPLTYAPYTTLQIARKPTIGTPSRPASHVLDLIWNRDLHVDQKDKYEFYGLGYVETDAEPWILREDLLRVSDPNFSHKGKSLAYFWQVSDPQLLDQESPCRMEGVNIAPFVVASSYRPQGIYSTHMFDLHVQTARRISDISPRPFDFALVTGDIADNAQKNEHAWFRRMMAGGVLNPDTGKDDDPIPGPGNDYNDPFYSRGIGNIPWYPAIGNHDHLYMGFMPFNETIASACTGTEVVDLFEFIPLLASHGYREGYRNGYQDGSTPNSDINVTGPTVADPDRRPLTKAETLQQFYESEGLPKGHGLDPERIKTGWGYYSAYPIPNKPIRLITLDTNSGSWSEANMTRTQFDWVASEIADARAKHELVIVQSHHGTSMFGGDVTQQDFQKLLASYSGVVVHITGHGHQNDSHVYIDGTKGYWEVMLASVVDFPSQSRIFEIVHEGKGYIAIYITNIDPNAPKGSFVDTALHYAAARKYFATSKDPAADWEAEKPHRNLILRTKVAEDVYKNLEKYKWSDTIISETVLNNLKFEP